MKGSPNFARRVSNLSRGVRARPSGRKGCRVTDTPIYDQMEWEFRGGGATEEPARPATPSPRRQDGTRRPVSVWALVNQHRQRS